MSTIDHRDPIAFAHRTRELLALEREAEVEEAHRLIHETPRKRLEKSGRALIGLQVQDEKHGFGGRLVLDLGRPDGSELPDHRFRKGDVVGLTKLNAEPDAKPGGRKRKARKAAARREAGADAVVTKVRRDRIAVTLELRGSEPDLPRSIDLVHVANDVTYRRLEATTRRLSADDADAAARVVDLCFGRRDPEPSRIESLAIRDEQLDDSQREAVAFALGRKELGLIHGPPGTGKTTALAEVLRQAALRGDRVLACAPTNVAVDNLAERLASSGLSMVRLGHPARVKPAVTPFLLERRLDEHRDAGVRKGMQKELEQALRAADKARDRSEKDEAWSLVRALRGSLREEEARATRQVLASADIIFCTTTGAGDSMLSDLSFDLAVVDEAAQALEIACWGPMLRARATVLAGDHRQLPPTILSSEASKGGLGLTLFDRLIAAHGEALARMLTTQYRMHQDIMDWSSERFYEGGLRAHESVAEHRLYELPGVSESSATEPIFQFMDTAGTGFEEEVEPEGESKRNPGEVDLVVKHLTQLLESGLSADELAVISPYVAQVQLLRRRLRTDHPKLEIDTVDGFQGREKEAVIISCVRSNDTGEIGFLADERRFNVAITRARRHVTIIGDGATLGRHALFEGVIDHAAASGRHESAFLWL